MDQIWEDINLISSLHHRPNATNSSTARFHLQDFLPPPPTFTTRINTRCGAAGGPGSSNTNPRPPPATTLNLSSGPPNKSKSKQQQSSRLVQKASPHLIISSSIKNLTPSSCGTYHSFRNNRPADQTQEDHSADDRFKRMIKNRESAARSRDRKHVSLSLSLDFFVFLLFAGASFTPDYTLLSINVVV